jgi:hypothetical protein
MAQRERKCKSVNLSYRVVTCLAYGRRGPLFREHEGNAAVRIGKRKLVRKYPGSWELYDMETDRTEIHSLAAHHPDRVSDMIEQ